MRADDPGDESAPRLRPAADGVRPRTTTDQAAPTAGDVDPVEAQRRLVHHRGQRPLLSDGGDPAHDVAAGPLGVSGLVFAHILGFGGADTSFPLFAFVFLVALGIDYNIFLMTRVREEALQAGTEQGALIGLSATGGVITSAGLVLAGTFAVLATLPLVFLAELGFAVAFGVLLDTIIVRSVLVTALNLDVGRWMWWPSRLSPRPGERSHVASALQPAGRVEATGSPEHKS